MIELSVENYDNLTSNVLEEGVTYYSPAVIKEGEIKLLIIIDSLDTTFQEAENRVPEAMQLFEVSAMEVSIIEFRSKDNSKSIEIMGVYTRRAPH